MDPQPSDTQAARDPLVEAGIAHLLRAIGEDPKRDGLIETPARFVRAMRELTSGLYEDPRQHLHKRFEMEFDVDGMIVLSDIPFTSLCEHHLLTFSGRATVGYIPSEGSKMVVGLSKLARCFDGYARRPQVQERLTQQTAQAIRDVLGAQGVGVIVSAEHQCMSCRGARKPGARMVTSCLLGEMRDSQTVRDEFMRLSHVT